MSNNSFDDMLGVVIDSIEGSDGDDKMAFVARDGRRFIFFHRQDCCESVSIEDVCGDLSDLIGSPLLLAEEATNENEPSDYGHRDDSYTWTFYRFATIKGAVTVRWLGESNGYYSEGVSFDVIEAPRCEEHEDCRTHAGLGRACLLDRSSPRQSEGRPKEGT